MNSGAAHRPGALYKPFRIFFPAAALWALLAIPVWLAMRAGIVPQPALLPAALWHAEEMLFGYTLAVVAGYLLPPLTATPLAILAGLWLLARAAWFVPALSPLALAAVAAAFPIALVGFGLRRFGPVKRARNLVFAAILIGLGLALLALLGAGLQTRFVLGSMALRLTLFLLVALIIVMGGRLIPAATIGALRERGRDIVIRVQPARESAAVCAVAALSAAEALRWPQPVCGAFALVIAGVLIARMKDWHSFDVWRLPQIWPLHLGYAWIAAGFALLGLARLGLFPIESEALHALAVGGIGTTTLAMMARLTRLRSPRRNLPRRLPLVHGLFAAAVVLRVAGPWVTADIEPALWWSAACWSLAYAGVLTLFANAGRAPGRPR
ncbi:MAG: NnrS family protein [Thiohalobacteraceae bacterium]